ncbi:MAG: hypothetical protein JSR17_10845 [Proteobacteria bacterium]|nr:hypothetical protein [Pseudomonadota bacterium]
MNTTKDGFMVLQHALASGKAAATNNVIALLEKQSDALKANLMNTTKDGFTVLQNALKNNHPDIVPKVIALLQKHPDALKANLSKTNRFGYNCLHSAANTGDFTLVKRVVDLIKSVFQYNSEAILKDLKKDQSKFKQKARDNQNITDLLGLHTPSAGYYPRYQQQASLRDFRIKHEQQPLANAEFKNKFRKYAQI